MNVSALAEDFANIQNIQLRDTVIKYFQDVVPEYFWTVPASLSGKYHSCFDAGKGGLVRHTRMCVMVADELIRLDRFSVVNADLLCAAMLMHDSFKNGSSGSHYHADHPRLAADAWTAFAHDVKLPKTIIDPIRYAIAWHSGQWSGPSTRENFDKPKEYSSIIECAHLADYIASRNIFDRMNTL